MSTSMNQTQESFLDQLESNLENKPRKQVVLFAARVARLVYDQMEDSRSREAVDVAELWALGLIDNGTVKKSRDAAYAAYAANTVAAYAAAYASAAATAAAYASASASASASAYATRSVLKINPNFLPKIKEIYEEIFH